MGHRGISVYSVDPATELTMAGLDTSAFQRILAVLVGLMVTLQVSASASVVLNGVEYKVGSSIARDVCIVGGGSSGTYAAVRLSDMGETVVVIEQKDRLGGHTETYTDPTTGFKYDIGVQVVSHSRSPITHRYCPATHSPHSEPIVIESLLEHPEAGSH